MKLNNRSPNIFIIDDAEIDNVIFKMLIQRVFTNSEINIAINGEIAIHTLLDMRTKNPELLPDYIFLDLTMPVMDGWQFLKEFDRLKIDPFHKIHIYILSSSIHIQDINRSASNPLIKDFLSKPIDYNKIEKIFEVA